MLTSTRRGISYPNTDRSDTADVPRDIAALVAALEVDVIYGQGLLAARPTSSGGSPGIQGRVYWATDVNGGTMYWDFGTGWTSVGSVTLTAVAQGILLSARPAASAANQGFYYIATDGGILFQNNSGSAWATMLSGSSSSEAPKLLFQGLVSNAAATVYTVPASTQTRYETCRLYNSDVVARTVTLYDGGTAAGNTILPATEIPAGDFIELDLSGMGGQAGATIAAVASAAAVIAMNLYGSEEPVGSRLYKKLYQGALPVAWTSLVTTTAREKLSHIRIANVHATNVQGAGLAQNGSAAVNRLQAETSPSGKIVAGGIMEVQSFIALASGDSLWGIAQGGGADMIITVYSIEG
jgi:hypothetical protein